MENDWLALWEVFKNFPVVVHLIYLAIILAMVCLMVCRYSQSRDVEYWWYDRWHKKIDNTIRGVRKQYKPKDRQQAYRDTFAKLWVELKRETGDDYNKLVTGERSIWIHLATRQRDFMRFYE